MVWLDIRPTISILLILIVVINGKISKGTISKKGDWIYLDKFCFDEKGGILSIAADDLNYDSNNSANMTKIAIYSDLGTQWPVVYKTPQSCEYKLSKASQVTTGSGEEISYAVKGQRPRWWYVVAINCGQEALNIKYRLEFLNEGGIFYRQFSKDTQGEYQTAIFFFLLFVIMGALQGYLLYVCIRNNYHTRMIFVIIFALSLKILEIMFNLIDFGKYSHDGVGAHGVASCATFWQMMCQITLLALFFCIVKGYPVSTNFIYGKRIILTVLFAFIVIYFALFIWYTAARDPALNFYIYDSIPGYVILILRVCAYVWCARELWLTYNYENDVVKKSFYIAYGIFITLWFLSLPLAVLIAHFIEDWVRAKIVYGIVQSIDAATFIFLCLLFRPLKGNKFFSVLDPNAQVTFGTNTMQIFPESN